MPVQKQILSKEGRHDHSASIMHPSGRIKLSHGGIDNGEACCSCFPGIFVFVIVLPFYAIKFLLEGLALKNLGEIVCNVHVELSPMNFVDDIVIDAQIGHSCVIDFSDGHCSEMEMS